MFVPSYFCFAAKHFADDDYKVEHLLISNEENIAKSLWKEKGDSAHRLMFVMCRGRLRSVDRFREELRCVSIDEDRIMRC